MLGVGVLEGVGLADVEAISDELAQREGTTHQVRDYLGMAGSVKATLGHWEAAKEIFYYDYADANRQIGGHPRFDLILRVYTDLVGYSDSASAAQAAADLLAIPIQNITNPWSWYGWIGDRCLVGLWYTRRSQAARARDMLELVNERTAVTEASFPEAAPDDLELCLALLRAMVAAETGGATLDSAVVNLDAVIRSGLAQFRTMEPESILLLAQLQARQGDMQGALATTRRRDYWWAGQLHLVPIYLRLEGQLAAEVGDTAGAIRAYQHYLALRAGADEALQPEVEEVREDLSRLLGEDSG